MNTEIYSSDTFIVVEVQYEPAPSPRDPGTRRRVYRNTEIGYEITDMIGRRITFLQGSVAEEFTHVRHAWVVDPPDQAHVEHVIACLIEVAPQPLVQH